MYIYTLKREAWGKHPVNAILNVFEERGSTPWVGTLIE